MPASVALGREADSVPLTQNAFLIHSISPTPPARSTVTPITSKRIVSCHGAGSVGEPGARQAAQPPLLPRADGEDRARRARVVAGAAGLDLDEGERAAVDRDDVELAGDRELGVANPRVAGNDAAARRAQVARRDLLGARRRAAFAGGP